ncbi:type II toxin-antitoxin system RelE/ParE family toxin [Brucella sp. IR073]|uniref:type II toxin-antitoxin system RelE/ParE family toxin n=1 Tax=unclassified Brucella TaxID=2632610 RepID=UPI003B981616
MKRPVIWTQDALDELRQQTEFIALNNPDAARRVADRIRDAANALGDTPTGRPGRVAGTYEKSLGRPPYILVYALKRTGDRETVVIVHLIHTARNWPAGGWPQ